MADDNKDKAKELMRRSYERKDFAAAQEAMGKRDIKENVKPGSRGYSYGGPFSKLKDDTEIPVGQQRLDIAKKYRDMAKKDSLDAVKLMKPAAIVTPVKRPSEAVMKRLTGKK
jgi:hypothetical protein